MHSRILKASMRNCRYRYLVTNSCDSYNMSNVKSFETRTEKSKGKRNTDYSFQGSVSSISSDGDLECQESNYASWSVNPWFSLEWKKTLPNNGFLDEACVVFEIIFENAANSPWNNFFLVIIKKIYRPKKAPQWANLYSGFDKVGKTAMVWIATLGIHSNDPKK